MGARQHDRRLRRLGGQGLNLLFKELSQWTFDGAAVDASKQLDEEMEFSELPWHLFRVAEHITFNGGRHFVAGCVFAIG